MVDQLGRDPQILQVLLDLRGVFLVDSLRGLRSDMRSGECEADEHGRAEPKGLGGSSEGHAVSVRCGRVGVVLEHEWLRSGRL